MTAINGCGNSKTIYTTVSIINNAYPVLHTPDGFPMWGVPGLEHSNGTAGCPGDAILFYFMGEAAANIYHFGDGDSGVATEQMVVDGGDGQYPVTIIKHAFPSAGTYTVMLTLTN